MDLNDLKMWVRQAVDEGVGEVLPGRLYIGSAYWRVSQIRDLGVTAVLNVDSEESDRDTCGLFAYAWVPAEDDGSHRPDRYWEEILEFAHGVFDNCDGLFEDGGLYVHCSAGVNRSAGAVYLILRSVFGYDAATSWELIASAREVCRPRYVIQVEKFLEERG